MAIGHASCKAFRAVNGHAESQPESDRGDIAPMSLRESLEYFLSEALVDAVGS